MPLNPAEMLRATQLHPSTSAYLVGANERNVTVFSQQQRALNIAYALSEVLKPGASVGVIGGGFAGVTAAAALILAQRRVTLYERSQELIPIQKGCTKRFLDPHLYDWPRESWRRELSNLPILNWQGGPATTVRQTVLNKFENVIKESTLNPVIRMRTSVADFDESRWILHDEEHGTTETALHDAVIVACGFGLETESQGFTSYWHDDDLDQPVAEPKPRVVLVSGTGDGALCDVLRSSVVDFSLASIRRRLAGDVGEQLREKLLKDLDLGKDPVAVLNQELERMDPADRRNRRAELATALLGTRRTDTTVRMSGLAALPWEGSAFALNRLYALILAPQYHRRKYASHRTYKKRIKVDFVHALPDEVDRLVLRHGPVPITSTSTFMHRVRTEFRDRWDAIGGLDLTRGPIYPKDWLQASRTRSKAQRKPRTAAQTAKPLPAASVASEIELVLGAQPSNELLRLSAIQTLGEQRLLALVRSTQRLRNARLRSLLPKPIVPEQFVTLELDRHNVTTKAARDFVPVSELLNPAAGAQILILGRPGAGKSTLAQFATYSAGHTPDRVGLECCTAALFLSLPDFVFNDGMVSARIAAALSEEHDSFWSAEVVDRFLNRMAPFPRLVVLDGLDEVPVGNERVLEQLLTRVAQSGARLVVACRSASIHRFAGLVASFTKYEIQPLTPNDVARFAEAQLPTEDAKSFVQAWTSLGAVRDDLITPLLVSMAIAVFARTSALPLGRSALYRDHFRMLHTEARQRRAAFERLDEAKLERLLSSVAENCADEFGVIHRSVLQNILLESRPRVCPQATPDELLAFLTEDLGIIVERGARLEFAHPSFHEYFLARGLVLRLGQDRMYVSRLVAKWNDRRFSEAIVFAIELASTEGLETGVLLESVALATKVDGKCKLVAKRDSFELEDVTVDVETGELLHVRESGQLRVAVEALAYVFRCLLTDISPSALQRADLAVQMVELVLSWLQADYREREFLRFYELDRQQSIVSILGRLCLKYSQARDTLRAARDDSANYGPLQRLFLASAIFGDSPVSIDDVRAMITLLERPMTLDRFGLMRPHESDLRESAMRLLLGVPALWNDGAHAVALMLPYWVRVPGERADFELLRAVLQRPEPPPKRTVALLRRYLCEFCCSRKLDDAERDVRTRAVLRSTSLWAAKIVLEGLVLRIQDEMPAEFPEAELLIELWQRYELRDEIREMVEQWEGLELLDSYARPYLHLHLR